MLRSRAFKRKQFVSGCALSPAERPHAPAALAGTADLVRSAGGDT